LTFVLKNYGRKLGKETHKEVWRWTSSFKI